MHKCLPVLAVIALTVAPSGLTAQTTPEASMKIWQEIKPDIVGQKDIKDAAGLVTITAPKRAQDAGLVPVEIAMAPTAESGEIKSVTFVIDVNPSPLAAKFTIGSGALVHKISTRVRVNDYSLLRVIAETERGELYMNETYVKASGGCSAPAVKSPVEAKATMGVMKLKQFPPVAPAASSPREMQLMVRHPNNSGFQMDQVTRNYIPPHFVKDIVLTQGGQDVLRIEGGISISEDPNFRFDYVARGEGPIQAVVTDTEGTVFKDSWPLEQGATN